MCEEPIADLKKIDHLESRIKKYNPGAIVIRTIFRPKPLLSIRGKKIFLGMTAIDSIEKNIIDYLETEYGCSVVKASFNLSRRDELRKDLDSSPEFDLILTELKAAAVDVLTEYASKKKKEIVYQDNIPIITSNRADLKGELIKLIRRRKNK